MVGREAQHGILEYFVHFFKNARIASRLAVLAYFAVVLITPVYGRPGETSFTQLSSAILIAVLVAVQVIAIAVLAVFNRKIPGDLRRAARRVFAMIAVPFILFLLSSIIVVPMASNLHLFLQLLVSVAMIVPLILVIIVLVESVIRTPFARGGARLSMGLALVTIALIIYTFGTLYFINGLIVDSGGQSVDFAEALYASGLAFTSLGFTDLAPIGPGKPLAVFESVAGYVTIALITTILVRIALTVGSPGSGDNDTD